jgi:hypothetical protein
MPAPKKSTPQWKNAKMIDAPVKLHRFVLALCFTLLLLLVSALVQPGHVTAAVYGSIETCHLNEINQVEPTPTPDLGLCAIDCIDPNLAANKIESTQLQGAAELQPGVLKILFYWMEGCPGCEEVIKTTMPVLEKKYGSLIDIRKIELKTLEEVDQLYIIGEGFGFKKEQIGVPFIIIDEQALSGTDQINKNLPKLIQEYLIENNIQPIDSESSSTTLNPNTVSSTAPCPKPVLLVWGGVTLALIIIGILLIKNYRSNLRNKERIK